MIVNIVKNLIINVGPKMQNIPSKIFIKTNLIHIKPPKKRAKKIKTENDLFAGILCICMSMAISPKSTEIDLNKSVNSKLTALSFYSNLNKTFHNMRTKVTENLKGSKYLSNVPNYLIEIRCNGCIDFAADRTVNPLNVSEVNAIDQVINVGAYIGAKAIVALNVGVKAVVVFDVATFLGFI